MGEGGVRGTEKRERKNLMPSSRKDRSHRSCKIKKKYEKHYGRIFVP